MDGVGVFPFIHDGDCTLIHAVFLGVTPVDQSGALPNSYWNPGGIIMGSKSSRRISRRPMRPN